MPELDERGVVLPSPVVLLSIIAVAMAAVAFVATRGAEPPQREVAIVAREETPTASASPTTSPATEPKKVEKKREKKPKPVDRSKTYVEVYNNSGITGLAGDVGSRASEIGWQVVGTDNWYGTIPVTTVYFPERLKAAAKQLALDLGVQRTAPIIDPMRADRLTVILTSPLG